MVTQRMRKCVFDTNKLSSECRTSPLFWPEAIHQLASGEALLCHVDGTVGGVFVVSSSQAHEVIFIERV